jgi:hypothetical protein
VVKVDASGRPRPTRSVDGEPAAATIKRKRGDPGPRGAKLLPSEAIPAHGVLSFHQADRVTAGELQSSREVTTLPTGNTGASCLAP